MDHFGRVLTEHARDAQGVKAIAAAAAELLKAVSIEQHEATMAVVRDTFDRRGP